MNNNDINNTNKSKIEISKLPSTFSLESSKINNVNNNDINEQSNVLASAPGTSTSSNQNGLIQTNFLIKIAENTIVSLPKNKSTNENYYYNISNIFTSINKQVVTNSTSFQQKKKLEYIQSTNKINMKLDSNISKQYPNLYSLKEQKTKNLNNFISKLPRINNTEELSYLFNEYIINGKITYLMENLKQLYKFDARISIYSKLVEILYDICMKSKLACEKLDLNFKRTNFILENTIRNHNISDLLDLDHEHNKFLAFSVMKLLEISEGMSIPTSKRSFINQTKSKTSVSILDQQSNSILNQNIEQVIHEVNAGLTVPDFGSLISSDIAEFNNNTNTIIQNINNKNDAFTANHIENSNNNKSNTTATTSSNINNNNIAFTANNINTITSNRNTNNNSNNNININSTNRNNNFQPQQFISSGYPEPIINNILNPVPNQNEKAKQFELNKITTTSTSNKTIVPVIPFDQLFLIQQSSPMSTDPRFKHYLTNLTNIILVISNKIKEINLLKIDYLMKESAKYFCISNIAYSPSQASEINENKKKLKLQTNELVKLKEEIMGKLNMIPSEESKICSSVLFKEIFSYLEDKISINIHAVNFKKCVSTSSTVNYLMANLIDVYYRLKREYKSFISKYENNDTNDIFFDNLNNYICLNYDLLQSISIFTPYSENIAENQPTYNQEYKPEDKCIFSKYLLDSIRIVEFQQSSNFQIDDMSKSPKDPRLSNQNNLNKIDKSDLKELNFTVENNGSNSNEINSINDYYIYVINKYKNSFELKEISNYNKNYSQLNKVDIVEGASDTSIASEKVLNDSFMLSISENKKSNESVPSTPYYRQTNNQNDSFILKAYETPVKSNINSTFSSIPPTPGGDYLFSHNDDDDNDIEKKKNEFQIYDSTPILNQTGNSLDNAPCLDKLLKMNSFFEEEKSLIDNGNNNCISKDLNNNEIENSPKNNHPIVEKDIRSRSCEENSNLESNHSVSTEKEKKLPGILNTYKKITENSNKDKNEDSSNNKDIHISNKLIISPSTYSYTSASKDSTIDSVSKNKILKTINDDQLKNIANSLSPIIEIDYNQINEINHCVRKKNSRTNSSSSSSIPSKKTKISSYSNENTLDNFDMSEKLNRRINVTNEINKKTLKEDANYNKNDDPSNRHQDRSTSRKRQRSRSRSRSSYRHRKRTRSGSRSSYRHTKRTRSSSRNRIYNESSRASDSGSKKDNKSNDSINKQEKAKNLDHESKTSSNEKPIENKSSNQNIQLYQYQFPDKLQLNKYDFTQHYIITYPTDSSTNDSSIDKN